MADDDADSLEAWGLQFSDDNLHLPTSDDSFCIVSGRPGWYPKERCSDISIRPSGRISASCSETCW